MVLRNIPLAALLGLGALAPNAVSAQKPDSGAFVVRLGVDTLAVERYVRTPRQLISDALLRTPRTRALRLTVNLNANGTVANYELVNSPVAGVPDSGPVVRTVVRYIGDSAHIRVFSAGTLRSSRSVATRGGILPEVQPFYSTYELALARTRRTATPQTFRMLAGSGPVPYQVRWFANGYATLYNSATGTLRARVDNQGHVLMLSGENTTFKVVVTRTRWLDVNSYARRYAIADVQGRPLGVLSPRDTVVASIGGRRMVVDYSRPAKRGRVVFGGLVPWRQVWRTGANAATQILFGSNVQVGGVAVPAGKYTLWSVPDPRNWQIIINRQTGQWGTEYDARQDYARIPVKVETLSLPVERFTIGIREANGQPAAMTLSWDRTRVVVPIVPIKKRMAPSLPQRT